METNHSDQGRVDRLRIHNSQGKALDFTIEPWGDVHPMASGEVFEVVANLIRDAERFAVSRQHSVHIFAGIGGESGGRGFGKTNPRASSRGGR